MSHIQRRRGKTGVTWRVRYTDPDGRERSRSFKRKADAEDFATHTSHTIRTGSYVDPTAGQITVRDYLEQWRVQQAHHRPSTASITATKFRTMIYPYLGDVPLTRLKPSTIRTWQRQLLDHPYAVSSIKVVRGMFAGALRDAVMDRLIAASPVDGVKLPEDHRETIVPLTVAQVHAGVAALPARYRALLLLAAGTGMRRGELWGLTVDRVDFLRKTIRVDRQLVGRRKGEPLFGPPKTKASVRTIPIAQPTVDVLAQHLARYPAGPGGLVFTTSRRTPLTSTVFAKAWRPAREVMGLGPGDGLHQLRHFYASLLIDAGRSVKEVQERLGHASAQETLDTYAHLFEEHDEGTRAAVEAAFGAFQAETADREAYRDRSSR